MRAIEGDEGSLDFQLPTPTVADVEHIGSGIEGTLNELRVTKDSQVRSEPELRIDVEKGTLEILVSTGASLITMREVLEEIAAESGDSSFVCSVEGKEVDLWYWPCFASNPSLS